MLFFLAPCVLDASSSWPSGFQEDWSVMARQSCKIPRHGWRIYLHIAFWDLKFQCSDPIPSGQQPNELCPCSFNLLIVPKLWLHCEKWTCNLFLAFLQSTPQKQMEPGSGCWGLGLKFIRQRSKEETWKKRYILKWMVAWPSWTTGIPQWSWWGPWQQQDWVLVAWWKDKVHLDIPFQWCLMPLMAVLWQD